MNLPAAPAPEAACPSGPVPVRPRLSKQRVLRARPQHEMRVVSPVGSVCAEQPAGRWSGRTRCCRPAPPPAAPRVSVFGSFRRSLAPVLRSRCRQSRRRPETAPHPLPLRGVARRHLRPSHRTSRLPFRARLGRGSTRRSPATTSPRPHPIAVRTRPHGRFRYAATALITTTLFTARARRSGRVTVFARPSRRRPVRLARAPRAGIWAPACCRRATSRRSTRPARAWCSCASRRRGWSP